MQRENKQITISIVSGGDYKILQNCLHSLPKSCQNFSYEVFVTAISPPSTLKDKIEKKYPTINFIQNKKPKGYGQNQNYVIKKTTTPFFLVLNDDTNLLPNALDILVEFLEKNKNKVAAVGPKILNKDGSLQYSARSFPNIFTGIFRRTFLSKLFPNNPYVKQYLMLNWEHNTLKNIDWISGACMLLNRRAIYDIGLFDEDFFMYVEDLEWCYRAHQKNWKIYYNPFAKIIHYGFLTTQKVATKMIIEHHKSMYKFYEKHSKKRGTLKPAILVGLTVRCVLSILENKISQIFIKSGK